MTLGEMNVSNELIGIILAAVGLATAILASSRGLRNEVKASEGRLRDEIAKLRGDMKAGDDALRDEIRALRDDMKARLSEARLRGAIDKVEDAVGELRGEVAVGFRVFGERLSKVEGVIEGMFRGDREPAHDTPEEGAA